MGRLDEAAFAGFHDRCATGLRAYVHRVIGNAADADDIVQEAFLRILRANLPSDDEEQWRRYVYRIASNLIVDRWRRGKFEQTVATLQEPAARAPHYEDDATVTNSARRIRYPSPVVRWSARTPFRARGSAFVAEYRWRAQRAARYARIALHPSDLDSPITARSVERSLDRWVASRRPTRYADLP